VQQIADELWQIALAPREGVNAYLLGDVLVDAGTARMGRRLAERLAGRPVTAHALTHAHPDHVGGSKPVVDALGVPMWAPAGDADAVEAGGAVQRQTPIRRLMEMGARFAPVRVDRRLHEGDEVGGFRVLDVPGHSPGHIAFWRESDRALVCGDVWFNLRLRSLRPGLREPLAIATVDPPRNRESMRRLAALDPEIACFGHGPVLRGAAAKLRAFVEALGT
jgi:hydroxyacylglutathione hydrolase